jgi:serine/threonine protein phosphatase PrpC
MAPSFTDSKRLTFAIGTGLDAGIKRKNSPNEDNLLVIQGTHTFNTRAYPFGLFVVADGMGGHSKGQEASRLAIQHMREVVMPALLSNAEIDSDQARELLLDALHHANLAVHHYNQQQQTDMGTTVTAAIIIDTTIAIANVGDSRTYLYRAQDGLKPVTKDHSHVAQLLARGEISEDDVYTHPRRNEIYRCIGEKATVQADTFILPLEAETTLLLCSDGLWEMVRKPHIEQILRDTVPNAAQSSKALIEAALAGGGLDNVSVIVVHIAPQGNITRLLPQERSPITPPVNLLGKGRISQ